MIIRQGWKGDNIYSLDGKCAAMMLYRVVLVWKCNGEVRL
jgi:hypothetical protein